VTHVAISLEACEAFREGREWPMSDDMQTSIRFYEERCAKFGVPPYLLGPNGFERVPSTIPWRYFGRRPNWRFKTDAPKTGNPDGWYSTQELMARRDAFIDGVMDDYE
jgi:hypothetical protein